MLVTIPAKRGESSWREMLGFFLLNFLRRPGRLVKAYFQIVPGLAIHAPKKTD
jgi:hypothetical protein